MEQKKGFIDLAKKSMLILGTSLLAINQSQGQSNEIENVNLETNNEIKFQKKLILKVNPNQDANKLLAFHRSHSSHSSHRSHSSHYSSSRGGSNPLPFIIGGGALLWGVSQLISDNDKNKRK